MNAETTSLDEEVDRLRARLDEEVLSRVFYFNHGTPEQPGTVFLGGAIQRKYHEIKPLVDAGLVEALDPRPSVTFHRDKLENFVYHECDQVVQQCHEEALQREQELLEAYQEIQQGSRPTTAAPARAPGPAATPAAAPSKQEVLDREIAAAKAERLEELLDANRRMAPVISRYKNKARRYCAYKEAFLFLLGAVKQVPSNRRVAADPRVHRDRLTRVLGSYDVTRQARRETINWDQGKRFYRKLCDLGFWERHSPARVYRLTPLGWAMLDRLLADQRAEKCPEELEFERMLQELHLAPGTDDEGSPG